MHPTQIILSCLLYTSLASAWPWPHPGQNADAIFAKRADSSSSITGTITNSASGSTASTSGPTKTGPVTTGPTKSAKATSGTTSATATRTTPVDPRLPAGGVLMITPAAAITTYYKVGDQVTFGWNYTSLIVTPSAIDVVVTCSANKARYTIASNVSAKETGVVWNTSADSNGMLTETYALIIHDHDQEIGAIPQSGHLSSYNSFQFAMYISQRAQYVGLKDFVCATCSGAVSDLDRQTMKFLLGMCLATVLSFTWFTNGFLSGF